MADSQLYFGSEFTYIEMSEQLMESINILKGLRSEYLYSKYHPPFLAKHGYFRRYSDVSKSYCHFSLPEFGFRNWQEAKRKKQQVHSGTIRRPISWWYRCQKISKPKRQHEVNIIIGEFLLKFNCLFALRLYLTDCITTI